MGSDTAQTRTRHGGIVRPVGVVGGFTLISRVLGLVRDIVIANVFGVSRATEAFFVANKIPNMLRRFFAEGAFSQAFVPVINEYKEQRSDRELRELVAASAGALGGFLFLVTLLGVVVAPLLVYVFAPGFAGDDRFDLTAQMLRYTFPYLLFISLTALAGGLLNTFGRFAVPAVTPVFLNVVLIAAAVWLAPLLAEPGLALAIGVFAAGVVQLVFQVPFLARLGILPRPRLDFRHPGVTKIRRLMLPALFGSSVAQINILIDNIIASSLALGSVSWLYYSDRLMEFPLGVFGIALATVILPRLSSHHAAAESERFSATIDYALRLVFLVGLPAAIGLIVLAGPMIVTIFVGGEFTAFDARMARLSLVAFSIGLPAFILVKVLAPAYFSRQDTRTPVRVAVVALAVNLCLNLAFVLAIRRAGYDGAHAGLALATSCAAVTNATLLYLGLKKHGFIELSAGWAGYTVRLVIAAAAMTLVLVGVTPRLDAWLAMSHWVRIFWLAGEIALGFVVYGGVLFALGLRPSMLALAGTDEDAH